MAEPTAQEQKARQGGTSGVERSYNEGSGTVFSVTEGQRVKGENQLVQQHGSRVIDMWNESNVRVDVRKLEKILSKVKLDEAYDLTSFIRQIEYQGFDREFYINHALKKMSVSVFVRFAIIGGIRGSKFQKISETCEDMPQDLISAYTTCSFISATPKKRTDLTILRNTASIPHWVAYWMLKTSITKKVPDSKCHPCIQFPGAASLPMSRSARLEHLDFSAKFSSLLPGGRFNMNIYMTAYRNAIPIEVIPNEVLEILGVASSSESYSLTDDDVATYSKAIVGPIR